MKPLRHLIVVIAAAAISAYASGMDAAKSDAKPAIAGWYEMKM